MGIFVGLFGIIGIIVTSILLIVWTVQKKPKKVILILLGASVISFIIGVAITPGSTPDNSTSTMKSSPPDSIGVNAKESAKSVTPDSSPQYESTANTTSSAEPSAYVTPVVETIKVKAKDIIDEYDSNELRADATYNGKVIEVTGVVTKIDTDIWKSDEYVLRMNSGDEWEFLTVDCYGISQESLAKVDVGSTVTVIGDFDDGGDLGVKIKNCYIKQ